MAKIGELIVKIGADASSLKKGLEDSTKSIAAVGEKMQGIGKTLSMTVTAPLVGAGIASFKFASDLQDAMGAADQIFKDSSSSVKDWADTLPTYYGIAEGEAVTYANTMGAMLQNIGGLSEAEAAKQSQTLVELAGDLSAMFGGTTESAVQALTGALKGNNAMLDNYGMGVNEATIKAKALEMGLYSGTGQMDLQTKQAATLALIMEQTADAQGQAAREAGGASGSWKQLATEIKNLATDIGEVLLPIITPLITKIGEIAAKFGAMSPENQKLIIAVAAIAAAIGPVLVIFGTLASAIGSIVGILPFLGTAFTILTGPIGIAIAIVVALIAIWVKWGDEIKALIGRIGENLGKFFKETIPNLINDALAFIKDFPVKVVEFLSDLPEKIGNVLGLALGNVVQFGIDAVDWAVTEVPKFIASVVGFYIELPGKIWEWLVAAYDKMGDWATNIKTWAKTKLPGVITSIVDFFKELPGKLLDIGVDMVKGLWDGIKSMVGWIGEKISGFVKGIADGFKEGMDIKSPSRVMADIGRNVTMGLAQGITGAADLVDKSIGGLINQMSFNPNVSLSGNAGAVSGALAGTISNSNRTSQVFNINITGSNADEIWDKFERQLALSGVRI